MKIENRESNWERVNRVVIGFFNCFKFILCCIVFLFVVLFVVIFLMLILLSFSMLLFIFGLVYLNFGFNIVNFLIVYFNVGSFNVNDKLSEIYVLVRMYGFDVFVFL